MQISGWSIDGFGVFAGADVRNLGRGLTVFLGPNEAGKSTLLAFIRGVLFGFPDGRSRAARYPPLRGGRHGGRVFIQTEDGEYFIDREAGRRGSLVLMRPDGFLGSEEDLARIVGAADESVFRNVFAFSLTELQSFESLTADGVRNRIFAAGVGGAGPSANEAAVELGRRSQTLLRPKQPSRITAAIADLKKISLDIDEAVQSARAYPARLAEDERCTADIHRVSLEYEALVRRRDRLTALLELWPAWCDLSSARDELEGLPLVESFPSGAVSQLAAVTQEIATLGRTAEDLEARRAHAQQRAAEADGSLDESAHRVADEADDLHARLSLHRRLLEQAQGVKTRLGETRNLLGERLAALGPGWDEARVTAFDGSLPRQEDVRTWQQQLRASSAEVERLGWAVEAAARRRDEYLQASQRDRAALGVTEPPDQKDLEARLAAVKRLRTTLADLHKAEADHAAQTAILEDRERAVARVEAEAVRGTPAWLGAAAAVAALVAAAAAVWRLMTSDAVGAAAMAVAALSSAAGAVWAARRSAADRAQHERHQEDIHGARIERNDSRQRCAETREHIDALLQRLDADGVVCGFAERPTPSSIEDADATVARLLDERRQWDDAQRKVAAIAAEQHGADEELARLQAAHRAAIDQAAAQRTTWDERCRAAGAQANLTPEGVLDFFDAVRRAREAMQARRDAMAAAVDLATHVGQWEERTGHALAHTGVTVSGGGDALIPPFLALRARVEADREARTLRARLTEELADLAARLASTSAAIERARGDRARLLASAGAVDDADFVHRLEIFSRRQSRQNRVTDLIGQIVARIGHGAAAASIQEELSTGAIDQWKNEREQATERLDQLQTERDEAVRRARDAQRAREQLETAATIVDLETRRNGLTTDLAAAVREWRVIAAARALIESTLAEYERTRQPAVLSDASTMFAAVTDGRYVRVVPDSDDALAVVSRKGSRRRVENLSRGTAEQLYLCLRLGLASEFARRSQALPLIMDDVLVNFDPDRARRCAHVLCDVASQRQILLFTCHPPTRDLLRDVDPSTAVVELPRIEMDEQDGLDAGRQES